MCFRSFCRTPAVNSVSDLGEGGEEGGTKRSMKKMSEGGEWRVPYMMRLLSQWQLAQIGRQWTEKKKKDVIKIEVLAYISQPRFCSPYPSWPSSFRMTPDQYTTQLRFRSRDPHWPISFSSFPLYKLYWEPVQRREHWENFRDTGVHWAHMGFIEPLIPVRLSCYQNPTQTSKKKSRNNLLVKKPLHLAQSEFPNSVHIITGDNY